MDNAERQEVQKTNYIGIAEQSTAHEQNTKQKLRM